VVALQVAGKTPTWRKNSRLSWLFLFGLKSLDDKKIRKALVSKRNVAPGGLLYQEKVAVTETA
jgi:hypothetical protein